VQGHPSPEQFHALQPTLLQELKLDLYELNPAMNSIKRLAYLERKKKDKKNNFQEILRLTRT